MDDTHSHSMHYSDRMIKLDRDHYTEEKEEHNLVICTFAHVFSLFSVQRQSAPVISLETMGVVLLQWTITRVLSACVCKAFQPSKLQRFRGLTMSSAKKSRTDDSANSDNQKRTRLVWVDLEMTGLDVEKEKIIEIACIVTSGNLDIIAEGPNIVIHQPKEVMDSMGDWCRQHHGQSGLTKAVLESKVSTEEAEEKVLSFVRQHTERGCPQLAGNSVYMDKMFLERYMPTLLEHLHYRIVDVSSVKELCRRWYPAEFESKPKKALTHRALDDIRESLKELQYYRQTIFKS